MSPQDRFDQAIAEVDRTGEEYAKAKRLESVLQNSRHGVKQEAIKRLMTGRTWEEDGETYKESAKASSVSAAEKMVELDADYAAHLAAQVDATFDKNMAYTRFTSARFRAFYLIQRPDRDMALDFDLVRNIDQDPTVGGVPL